jgi:hypothetical protein
MKEEEKRIILENTSSKTIEPRSFTKEHAAKILRRLNTGGWVLANNSEYTFTKENGFKLRANKGDTKDSKK